MLEIKDLYVNYGAVHALNGISMTVKDGEIVSLIGANGAGKTTTMNILTGYLSSTSGRAMIDGMDILEHPMEVKKKIGFLPEQPPLYMSETPLEYLAFVGEAKGLRGAELTAQIADAVERTGIDSVKNRIISTLSKGYRQRVGIAQALLGAPQLIILDEPTVGLDPAQVIEIRRLIRELGKSHTVILSSHILSEVQAVCSQVLILSKGHLVAVGAPEQLAEKLNPGSRLRATALGGGKTVLKTVGSIPGIRKVEIESEADGQVTFTAESADASDRRAEVSRALSQAGCTVLALAAENRTLEEVFLALTENESETPSDEGEEKTE